MQLLPFLLASAALLAPSEVRADERLSRGLAIVQRVIQMDAEGVGPRDFAAIGSRQPGGPQPGRNGRLAYPLRLPASTNCPRERLLGGRTARIAWGDRSKGKSSHRTARATVPYESLSHLSPTAGCLYAAPGGLESCTGTLGTGRQFVRATGRVDRVARVGHSPLHARHGGAATAGPAVRSAPPRAALETTRGPRSPRNAAMDERAVSRAAARSGRTSAGARTARGGPKAVGPAECRGYAHSTISIALADCNHPAPQIAPGLPGIHSGRAVRTARLTAAVFRRSRSGHVAPDADDRNAVRDRQVGNHRSGSIGLIRPIGPSPA